MDTPVLTMPELTHRVVQLEQQVVNLRQELDRAKRARATLPVSPPRAIHPSLEIVDKELLRQAMDDLFKRLGISGAPIGALALQEQMQQEGLGPTELSQGIIDAREE